MKYEIFVVVNGVEKSTNKKVRSVEQAEELCAIFTDMDNGKTYTYKEVLD